MGSTFWAVSYFRSLKRIKVLASLTKYLVQYKRVSIPHVGTFEIVQESPKLHIGDKTITAPMFITKYVNNDRVPDHQFHFIACCEKTEKEKLQEELSQFGKKLKNRIENSPFCWKGFGTLRYASSQVVFDPQSLEFDSLKFIPAQKVMRQNVQHSVLVGDQQMTSHQVTNTLSKPGKRMPLYMIIGWILFILAVIAIILFLFFS